MSSEDITLYVMVPVPKPRSWRKRYGYYAVHTDGTIYLPGEVAAGAMEVFLCAGADGVSSVLTADNVPLYPSDWLAREFPKATETVARIVARIKEHGPPAEGR